MMSSMLILSLAYALVAALLLTLCITLPGRRMLKIALIALVSVFYAVTWIGHQSMLGWPTGEGRLPYASFQNHSWAGDAPRRR